MWTIFSAIMELVCEFNSKHLIYAATVALVHSIFIASGSMLLGRDDDDDDDDEVG